jgi:hypothetical protein
MQVSAQPGSAGRIQVDVAVDDHHVQCSGAGQHRAQRRKLAEEEPAGTVRRNLGHPDGPLGRDFGKVGAVRQDNGRAGATRLRIADVHGGEAAAAGAAVAPRCQRHVCTGAHQAPIAVTRIGVSSPAARPAS